MSQPHAIRNRIMDVLHNQSAASAASGAFEIINTLQTFATPANQVIATACAYRNICDVMGLDPMEPLRLIARMEQDCRYRHVNTLSAVRKYVEKELLPHFP